MRRWQPLIGLAIGGVWLAVATAGAQTADVLQRSVDTCLTERADANTAIADLEALGWVETMPADLRDDQALHFASRSDVDRLTSYVAPGRPPDPATWKGAWERVALKAGGLRKLLYPDDATQRMRFLTRAENASVLKVRTQTLDGVRIVTCRIAATPDLMPQMLSRIEADRGQPLSDLPPAAHVPLTTQSDGPGKRAMFMLILDAEEIAILSGQPYQASASVETIWHSAPNPNEVSP